MYFLFLAIIFEVIASSLLKAADGFKKLLPTLGVIIGYLGAFYFLAKSLLEIELGTAYALWAGLGTALTAAVSIYIYKESFNRKKLVSFILIISGVMLLNYN